MVAGGRERGRGRVRVRGHRARLNVEVGCCGAGRGCAGSAASMLDHVRVLSGEGLRGDGHIVPLRDNGHVVRVSGVRVRMRMRHGRHAHRRGLLVLRRHVRRVRHGGMAGVATVRGCVLRRGLGVRSRRRGPVGSAALLRRSRPMSRLRTAGSLVTMGLRLRLLLWMLLLLLLRMGRLLLGLRLRLTMRHIWTLRLLG